MGGGGEGTEGGEEQSETEAGAAEDRHPEVPVGRAAANLAAQSRPQHILHHHTKAH